MSGDDKLRTMLQDYELPPAPHAISRGVAERIRRRKLLNALGLRFAVAGGIGLAAAGCWALSGWDPVKRLAATLYASCGYLMPSSMEGLLWYALIWAAVAFAVFGGTLLIAGGLRSLED